MSVLQEHKYETHTHSSESSPCSRVSAAELVRFYSMNGFSGICITDHLDNFLRSKLAPGDLPWTERIERFCRGYENALSAGMEIGVDVLFGWEYSEGSSHFLTYGLDKQWLLQHPDLLELDFYSYCDLIRLDGGFIVQAHPFREEQWIRRICLYPREVHAVEVINACRPDFQNRCADQYADNYGLLKIAGSDNHRGPLERLGGMRLTRRLSDVHDMIHTIKNGQAKCFLDDVL